MRSKRLVFLPMIIILLVMGSESTSRSNNLGIYRFEDIINESEHNNNLEGIFDIKPDTTKNSPHSREQKDILGWQDSRWGMSDSDIIKTFGNSLEKLPKRSTYSNAYVDYIIPNLMLSNSKFTVYFQMDAKTNRLGQILIQSNKQIINAVIDMFFGNIEQLLIQKYGTPNSQIDNKGVAASKKRQWAFQTTIIELSYYLSDDISNYISIRYFPSAESDARKL